MQLGLVGEGAGERALAAVRLELEVLEAAGGVLAQAAADDDPVATRLGAVRLHARSLDAAWVVRHHPDGTFTQGGPLAALVEAVGAEPSDVTGNDTLSGGKMGAEAPCRGLCSGSWPL